MDDIRDEAEELLEALFGVEMREGSPLNIKDERIAEQAEDLAGMGFVKILGDGGIVLTDEGRERARVVVRRHRLAERLLVDVLDVRGEVVHETACGFEHIVRPEIEEKICTLLGHPKVCPHGRPIPPGSCCERAERQVGLLVSPLSNLKPGEGGRIAYVHASDVEKLNKLMAMGVLPGEPVKLIRRLPSYVFKVGNTQYAVDRQIAEAIYVRLSDEVLF